MSCTPVGVCAEREGLLVLAKRILALEIPEKDFVHADNMISCSNADEYSIAFYEAAKQLTDLLMSGYSLEQGVKALANKIPAVEDLKIELKWNEDNVSCVSREQIYMHAEKVMKIAKDTEIEGPDVRLARRTVRKKLSTSDWKLAALRLCDIEVRIVSYGLNLAEFLDDETRCEMEFTEMRKHLEMVRIEDKSFVLPQPRLPPWLDVVIWEEDYLRRGYTEFFPIPVMNLQSREHLAAETDEQDRNDVEWPPLKKPAHMNMPLQDKGKERMKVPTPNAWTDRAKKKAFMNSGIARSKLNYKPPDSAEKECVIDIARAYTTKDVWGHALLGQFVGRHPGHSAIITMMKQWKSRAKYKEEQGWMIFNFESEEEQEEVLKGGPYLIHGRPLILKHVPDKFAFTNKDFATVPLWIRIHGLATRFWTEEYLGNIASYVGKPLYLDPVTEGRKRHSYARVLVEINLSKKVVRKVPLRFSDGDHLVCPIQIENEPKFCQHCCAFGHLDSECQFLAKAAEVAGVKRSEASGCSKALPTERNKTEELRNVSATDAAATGSKDADLKTAEAAEISKKKSMTATTLKTLPAESYRAKGVNKYSASAAATESKGTELTTAEAAGTSAESPMAAATLKTAEQKRTQLCPSQTKTAEEDGKEEPFAWMDRPSTAEEDEEYERNKAQALVDLKKAGFLVYKTKDGQTMVEPPSASKVHHQHYVGPQARDRK